MKIHHFFSEHSVYYLNMVVAVCQNYIHHYTHTTVLLLTDD